ncbi:30S ribosomal protein S14 [candidate division SR1 bacterium Aalborg_AAW-1]|nr:30S ribosomal protein S14 [candidate division SR1 bacterium Aalborg_AAW-1]
MAKTSLKVKQKRLMDQFLAYKAGDAKKPKHLTKLYNRCRLCGRDAAYMRDFGICRVCFRKNARMGLIMGVKKASW